MNNYEVIREDHGSYVEIYSSIHVCLATKNTNHSSELTYFNEILHKFLYTIKYDL